MLKVLQIETVRRALAQRGIQEDMLHLEHAGIPDALAAHGLTWEALGLKGATLFYRRRIEDMPLVEIPDDADPARRQRFEATRRQDHREGDAEVSASGRSRSACRWGCWSKATASSGCGSSRRASRTDEVVPVDGAIEEVRAPLVISSIGSIPEPMPGIKERGELYDFSDRELGRLAGYETVFGAGNAVTGKGNIVASRKHSIQVATHLIEQFLGLGEGGHEGEEALLETVSTPAHESAEKLADWLGRARHSIDPRDGAILRRVRARQDAVGYTGSYRDWIKRHAPVA